MRRRNLLSLILFLIYLVAVAWCCFGHFDDMPSVEQSLLGIPTDKVVHFLMFFPFPVLFFLTIHSDGTGTPRAIIAIVLIFMLGCLVAAATEIGQTHTTYRSGDPKDFIADVLGLALASLFTLIFYLRRNKTLEKKDA